VLYDADGRENVVRVVLHDGSVYVEAQGRHGGHVVHTLVRVPRAHFLPHLLGMST
jgi:hypothetical protein